MLWMAVVGANRVIPAAGIIHPVGNADLPPAEEKQLRRRIIEHALAALQAEVSGPTVFPNPAT
jgi:glycine reductase